MTPFRQGPFEALPERPVRAHAYFETEGLDLTVSSVFGRMKVHVRKHGAGPPLVLVHGLMTSSYSFRYVLAPLGEKFTCYAPDLPGAGRSDAPLHVPYTPSNLARWLADVMTALSIRGAPMIANSMGGYIALHLALEDAGAVSKLVDVHSPGAPDLRMWALRCAFALPGSRAMLRAIVGRDPLRFVHRNVHYFDEGLKSLEEARVYAAPLMTPDGLEAFAKYLSETMSTEHMGPFHRTLEARARSGESFPVPLLLLYAERDPMVPPAHGEVFAAKIPSARHVVVRDASHFMHVDAVERFLPPVVEFLSA